MGLIQSDEGLKRKQAEISQERGTMPADCLWTWAETWTLSWISSLPCRVWTCQPPSFLSQFLKRNPFLSHSFSLSLFPLGKNIYWFVCLFPTGSISQENSDWQKHYISMYYYIITMYFIILDIFVHHLNFPLDYDINFYPWNTANHVIGITLPLLKCKILRTKTVSMHLYIPIANCRWSINIFEQINEWMDEKILPHNRQKCPRVLSSCHISLINSVSVTDG